MDEDQNSMSKDVNPAGSSGIGAQEELICDGKYVVVERGDQQRIILFKSHQ